MNILLVSLFAAFGIICGVYLSVVGFVVTSVVIFGFLGVLSAVMGGALTPSFLFFAFISAQVGYFLALMGFALADALRRRPTAEKPVEPVGSIEHEQPR